MFKTLKSKFAFCLAFCAVLANSAMAAVTLSNSGEVSGNLELNTFYGMAGVVVVGVAAIWAVKSGLRLLRS